MKRNILYAGTLLLAMTVSGPAHSDDPEQAARDTANGAQACIDIWPFWWEIGDASAMAVGETAPTDETDPGQDKEMAIASASKWIYAAYVAERRGGDLRGYDIQFLTLESGYHSLTTCSADDINTVDDCLAYGDNGYRSSDAIGKFAYNGGHFEAHASNYPGLPTSAAVNPIDLGAYYDADLKAEINDVLGTSVVRSYAQPLLPGGVRSTPGLYADFLRAIMSDDLQMYSLLGTFQVCAGQMGCSSGTVLNSPIPAHWNYSIGHWVETDNDNAYSNAGVRGFYAWISKYKDLYGIVGRDVNPRANETEDTSVSWDSVQCGQLIRKAYITGVPQT